jgi:hypothetical protein
MPFLLTGLGYAAGTLAAWLLIVRSEQAEVTGLRAQA